MIAFKMRSFLNKSLFLLLVLFIALHGKTQYQLSVPFSNGFVGDNNAQNVSSNSVYLSSLGWSNIQFAQNSTATTFVSQGNDIIGYVLITDFNGVEHTIPGYVKWRAPSGQVTSLVFSPTSTKVLATNGSNGSSTYTISSSKYIGLIFNGKTLTIAGNGDVSGNAATQGLLEELNSYLGTFPYLTVPNYTVYESDGRVWLTLTLSTTSTSTITVAYTTSDSTALSSSDYTSKSGTLTFAPGEKTKTIEVILTVNGIYEPTEYFKVIFSDAINASIQKGTSIVTVLEPTPLGVELVSLSAECFENQVLLKWQTASEHNSDYFVVQRLSADDVWLDYGRLNAQGESTVLTDYQFQVEGVETELLYRLLQFDQNGQYAHYGPILAICHGPDDEVRIYPNPNEGQFVLNILRKQGLERGLVKIVSLDGKTLLQEEISVQNGANAFSIDLPRIASGTYMLYIEVGKETDIQPVIVR